MRFKLLFLFAVVFIVSCNTSEQKVDEVAYNKTKESLEERERNSPLSFLSVHGTDKKNLIGQTVIKGVIENKASVCAYKDVRIKMLFYKAGELVANHEQVMEDPIKANNTYNFKSKYKTPKGTDSVGLSIMSATVVDAD